MPYCPLFPAQFSALYVDFVLNATRRYGRPMLPVFLAQGNMNNGKPLHDAIQVAVAGINARGGAATYLDLRAGPTDGCGNHPGVLGHAAMYRASLATIAAATGWVWDYSAGFIAAGNDVVPPLTNVSLADAQSQCLSLPSCVVGSRHTLPRRPSNPESPNLSHPAARASPSQDRRRTRPRVSFLSSTLRTYQACPYHPARF